MRPDIRVRIRGGVIRIRVHETGIRAVIRITAEVNPTRDNQPFISLFYVISRSGRAHRDFSGKRVQFTDFSENVLDFPRVREKLLRLIVLVFFVHLDFDENTVCPEFCFHSLDIVTHPKREVNQFLLCGLRAVEMFVRFIRWDFQKVQ